MYGLAIVADARRPSGQIGRLLWISGRDHPPAIDEYLGTDLFGHYLAVALYRTARGGLDARFEPQVGGMLGRVAHATPPKDGALLDQIVQPRLTDLGSRQLECIAIVGHGPQKGKGARYVIVGHDEGLAQLLVDIVLDLAKLLDDALVGPALKGTPNVHPDDLAQYAGVNAFLVILGNCGHFSSPSA